MTTTNSKLLIKYSIVFNHIQTSPTATLTNREDNLKFQIEFYLFWYVIKQLLNIMKSAMHNKNTYNINVNAEPVNV